VVCSQKGGTHPGFGMTLSPEKIDLSCIVVAKVIRTLAKGWNQDPSICILSAYSCGERCANGLLPSAFCYRSNCIQKFS
jgi:hypothetical protein